MLEARRLPLHRDPADRILAATAMVLDMTLITADERLLGLGNIKTLANR
jgi:PIN domain nuclease of toxin-antitoxin system